MEARLHSVSPTLKPCDTSEAAASRPSPTPTLAPQNGGLSVNTDPMVYEERSSLSWLWWLLIIPGVLLLGFFLLVLVALARRRARNRRRYARHYSRSRSSGRH